MTGKKTTKKKEYTDEDQRRLLEHIVKILDDKLAKEIQVIEVTELTSLCDFFVICSGESTVQLKAMLSEVQYVLKHEHDLLPLSMEGEPESGWLLLDYGDIIVHLFLDERRQFYRLERLWGQGNFIELSEFIPVKEGKDEG